MVNETLIRAEQEIRDLEKRYSDSIKVLPYQLPRWDSVLTIYRRGAYAQLGQIDGVPVVEVGHDSSRKGEEDQVEKEILYKGSKYAWVCSNLPWYGYGPMRRAVKLNSKEMPHVFGIATASLRIPTRTGIYVPQETLALARRRHAEEVLSDYPAAQVSIGQLKELNISSDFIFRIDAEMNLKAGKSRLMKHAVIVKPVTNGTDYTDGQDYGLSEELTEFQIKYLRGPWMHLPDFYAGKKVDRLESIRETIGAACFLSTSGYRRDVHNYSFRFDRVLSTQKIAEAFQKLGQTKNVSYTVTLFRLNDQLRELVNLPLDQAFSSPIVKGYVDQDFLADQGSCDGRYLSLSVF